MKEKPIFFGSLFQDVMPGLSSQEAFASIIEKENSIFSYQNCFVAYSEGEIVQILLFLSPGFHLPTSFLEIFSKNKQAQIQKWKSQIPNNSFYIVALNQKPFEKITLSLLDCLIQKAKEDGVHLITTHVDTNNTNGQECFSKIGFKLKQTFENMVLFELSIP